MTIFLIREFIYDRKAPPEEDEIREVQKIRNIHTNFEKKIRKNQDVHRSLESNILGKIISFCIISVTGCFAPSVIVKLFEIFPREEIIQKSLLIFFVLFIVFGIIPFIEKYLPKFLTQYLNFSYIAEMSWKSESTKRDCYIIFDVKNSKITIKFYETDDYVEILQILEESGLSYQNEKEEFYLSDSALTDPTMDDLSRWPFAERIAQNIAYKCYLYLVRSLVL